MFFFVKLNSESGTKPEVITFTNQFTFLKLIEEGRATFPKSVKRRLKGDDTAMSDGHAVHKSVFVFQNFRRN